MVNIYLAFLLGAQQVFVFRLDLNNHEISFESRYGDERHYNTDRKTTQIFFIHYGMERPMSSALFSKLNDSVALIFRALIIFVQLAFRATQTTFGMESAAPCEDSLYAS